MKESECARTAKQRGNGNDGPPDAFRLVHGFSTGKGDMQPAPKGRLTPQCRTAYAPQVSKVRHSSRTILMRYRVPISAPLRMHSKLPSNSLCFERTTNPESTLSEEAESTFGIVSREECPR